MITLIAHFCKLVTEPKKLMNLWIFEMGITLAILLLTLISNPAKASTGLHPYATKVAKPTFKQCITDFTKLYPNEPKKVLKICTSLFKLEKDVKKLEKVLKEIEIYKRSLINEKPDTYRRFHNDIPEPTKLFYDQLKFKESPPLQEFFKKSRHYAMS